MSYQFNTRAIQINFVLINSYLAVFACKVDVFGNIPHFLNNSFIGISIFLVTLYIFNNNFHEIECLVQAKKYLITTKTSRMQKITQSKK